MQMSIDQTFHSPTISRMYGWAKSQYWQWWNWYMGEPSSDTMNEVFPRIYISDLRSSLSQSILDEHGITHIVSAVAGVSETYPDKYKYLTLPILDNTSQDMNEYFYACNTFVSNALSSDDNHRVLIHCMVGASRSATLAAAYIYSETGHDMNDIISAMRDKRDIVNPNPNFVQQLQRYADMHIS